MICFALGWGTGADSATGKKSSGMGMSEAVFLPFEESQNPAMLLPMKVQ